MRISTVDPSSPLYGRVRPGFRVISINDRDVIDPIDFRFRTSGERGKVRFADPAGKELELGFEHFYPDDLGLSFADDKIFVCKNNCIFCFVLQQPRGMRRSLYIKDEDYRLSFTHGNFVTLSNTNDADIERIIEQRLSPMYVSVHASDDTLRRCMLKNEKLDPIIPRLRQLTEGGIEVHSQVVLCPGVNDGSHLEKTIDDLASLYPGVPTLAVVPVGLTKYRKKLPNLRTYRSDEAGTIIDFIKGKQRSLLKKFGTRFVWPADEFFVNAARDFPGRSYYEEMSQFENGIGMSREFIHVFNRRRRFLKDLNSDRRILFLTGHSAVGFFQSHLMPYLNDHLGLNIQLQAVDNNFWGEMVTVSGLLTGQDMLRVARSRERDFDCLVIPPNCLNQDDLFLDNMTLSQFEQALGKPVVIGQYDLAATIREVCR